MDNYAFEKEAGVGSTLATPRALGDMPTRAIEQYRRHLCGACGGGGSFDGIIVWGAPTTKSLAPTAADNRTLEGDLR